MTYPLDRVAVIGAGISGVVAAAHLIREGIDVTVFERSSAAGGIWLYDERKPLDPVYESIPVSKVSGTYLMDEASEHETLIHAPPGPCYIGLRNNVSTRLLETTLNPFPTGTEEFVSHNVLKDYIQDTAIRTGVHEVTRYDTDVSNLSKTENSWIVKTTTLQIDDSGKITRELKSTAFGAVVVASGHYHTVRVPNTPGLADWKRRWPDRVQHSKRYRSPEDAQGKNFLLVGGSVSSTDIARELGPLAKNIYQSHRNGNFDSSASMLPENGYRVDEVVSYDTPTLEESTLLESSDPIPATVTLKSGQKLCDIHHVILATGYHLTLPFLPHLHSDQTSVDKADDYTLVTDGTQFHNIHKDIFYIKDPSLVFIGVPFFTATFTLFEFQAMVVAKVLSGQAKLPSQEDMRSEYNERVKMRGYGKPFHSLQEQEAEYVKDILAWVNYDLEKAGKNKLDGHTDRWHVAKAEQVQRFKALREAPRDEKRLEIICY
ncbi:dimethylaniline monooxygenase [Phaeosphaeriaceae sp. PMI808]|nr:dimethylaniline monooxygenase [Phaeosphaeriaceae sp. PMI808]